MSQLKNYTLITVSYWGFTITDGALRMLVLLYFHNLGYKPLEIAFLFLFYEIFGVVTNLIGGWIGSRLGLNKTMHVGLFLQIVSLLMLVVNPLWLTVSYVMFAQALSGIAKDLNKMSAKSSVKLFVPKDQNNTLFKWVAVLTGSKNALKGFGFFLGGFLLTTLGFGNSALVMAAALFVILLVTIIFLPSDIGKSKHKVKFKNLFSKTPEINALSAARLFLFGSRDIWFVVALPVFFAETLGWSNTAVGTFFACWIIGYGFIQGIAPKMLKGSHHQSGPDGKTARLWAFLLAIVPVLIVVGFNLNVDPTVLLVVGLAIFGFVFAVNSSLHSYLILAYTDHDKVALNVGFYYMANASGRLLGTVLSGLIFQYYGLVGCLAGSAIFLIITSGLSYRLPVHPSQMAKK